MRATKWYTDGNAKIMTVAMRCAHRDSATGSVPGQEGGSGDPAREEVGRAGALGHIRGRWNVRVVVWRKAPHVCACRRANVDL